MNAKGFKCTENRVLIEPYQPTQTQSGIILTTSANEFPESGHVLDVGPKCTLLKEGDYVYYGIPRANPIKFEDYDNDGLLLIPEQDIMGVLEPLADGEREKTTEKVDTTIKPINS